MAEHDHGNMNISEQEQTFESFVRWTIRVAVFIIVALILLAIVNG